MVDFFASGVVMPKETSLDKFTPDFMNNRNQPSLQSFYYSMCSFSPSPVR
ncbi:MAG TPA: hypothetical protein VK517_02010 [Cyclobacteriaceae bacterium]|nr:hypothetical protein [Cyclobacteriaceae bacterium]